MLSVMKTLPKTFMEVLPLGLGTVYKHTPSAARAENLSLTPSLTFETLLMRDKMRKGVNERQNEEG